MKPLALVVLAAALLGDAPQSRKLQPRAWFPLRSNGSVVAIAGEIQGKPLWFDLDTGATSSTVDLAQARALRLPSLGAGRVRGAGTGEVSVRHLGRFAIHRGRASFTPTAALALDLSNVGSAIRLGGLLGCDFYPHFVVEVDSDAKRVTLFDPKTYVYGGRGVAIPLVIRPPRAFVYVTVAAQGVAAERHLLRLDAGSSDGVDDDIVLRSTAPKKTILGGVGIGGRFKTYLGTIALVRIGPFALHAIPSATGGVQLVGNAIWRRFNVVFDLSRSVMYLTPRR